jgi:Terpene cyclase DEP1
MKKISALQLFYLFFAIGGLIIPWYYNIQQVLQTGKAFTLADYFNAGFSSPLASSITTDFFIGTTPVLVWMYLEGKRLRIKGMWAIIAGTFLVAFAFTCPLFLFLRERKMAGLGHPNSVRM